MAAILIGVRVMWAGLSFSNDYQCYHWEVVAEA